MAIPDTLSPTFPPRAVDHVVTYASWRGWGPRDGDRAVMTRHGDLVHLEIRLLATRRPSEAEVENSFANLATGASMSLSRDAQGALAAVSFWQGERDRDRSPIYRHRLTRTSETEQIAGERCTIWRAEPEEPHGPGYSACVSADGILLRDTVLFSDGTVMSERHALSVDRRRVAPAEVLPPREALDWAYWTRATSGGHAQNYALSLVGRNPNGAKLRRNFIADGGFSSEEQRTGAELASLFVAGPNVRFSYQGAQPHLEIGRLAGPFRTSPVEPFGSAPMADRPPLGLLGETCHWFDASVGVSDYSRIECRAADRLPLVIEERSRGRLNGRWEAVSLSRGRTPPGSVRPPAALLSWRRWGWPMLERPPRSAG